MSSRISVIIPVGSKAREGNLHKLLNDVQGQTITPHEVEIVRGISPNGLARNHGVENTSGDILVFLDDDVRLGTPDIIEKFCHYLGAPEIGLVGTSQQLTPDSSPFQQRCAAVLSRSQSPVVNDLTDSDMVTTQCCAIRREVLIELGGFHSRILRGVDPELRHRIRGRGYRICVVPQAWHYHPMPASLRALLEMGWRDGYASAFAQRHFPDTVIFNPEGHVASFDPNPSLRARIERRVARTWRSLATFDWPGLFYDFSYLVGYLALRVGFPGRVRGTQPA